MTPLTRYFFLICKKKPAMALYIHCKRSLKDSSSDAQQRFMSTMGLFFEIAWTGPPLTPIPASTSTGTGGYKPCWVPIKHTNFKKIERHIVGTLGEAANELVTRPNVSPPRGSLLPHS